MQINSDVVTTPPLDSATVVMLRDGPTGLEVLLLKRHAASSVLGGAFVFPGGKLDAADAHPDLLQRLDRPAAALHAQLGEADLPEGKAASLFVAAMVLVVLGLLWFLREVYLATHMTTIDTTRFK